MSDDDKGPPAAGAAQGSATGSATASPAASGPDIAMLGNPTENGVQILRMREGQVELGELRAAPEGKPILGESVRLHARDDHPGVYDVETVARGPLARRPAPSSSATPASRKGPAKVSSEAYRSGWDSIFSSSGDHAGGGRHGGGKPGGDLPN